MMLIIKTNLHASELNTHGGYLKNNALNHNAMY